MANTTYKIKQGDTLAKIAKDNGTTVQDLAKINNISNPNLIYAGNTIKLTNDVGGGSSASTTQNKNTTTPKSYSDIDLSKYDSGYQKSDDVIAAENKKTEAENAVSNYGDFAYSNDTAFKDAMDKILNREKFSYDLNGDALYQQYKDKYIQQGKMAMQDTMGQAAAMTGGYGNSYAASVGNQAYQASLENLNDIVPELYQMAYDKYNQEGQDLYNQYAMLADDRNMEYGMWGDKRNQLLTDRDYYGNEANNAYAKDYGEWADARDFDTNQYWNETNFGYGKDRDKITDEQWDKTFNEGVRQVNSQDAYNMLKVGVMPSDAVLKSAGISKEDAQKIVEAYKNGGDDTKKVENSGGVDKESGSDDNTTVSTGGVSSKIKSQAAGYTTNAGLQNYLNGLVADGEISEDQAVELYASNKNSQEDLKDRTWTKTGKDSTNWFWGVDNNDKVKDQYGNVYRLDDLVDALVEEGMSKKDAKAFVKKYN